MKISLQLPIAIKIGICLSTSFLLSLNAFAEEPRQKNSNEGTLVGAIQTLVKNNQKLNRDRIITGNIKISKGIVEYPYVMLKGTTTATFVDKNGNFQLDVPKGNAVIIVGGKGIEERELVLDTEDHYNIELVVNVDNNPYQVKLYGMPIDRRSYNGAFDRLSAQDINSRAAVTVGTALEGAVAGLGVTGMEAGLDGSGLNINIRGRGSLHSNNAPLIVLDGAPYTGNLHSINPNDVGDITVLKDGLGKSIYGVRGGNGIILITTKRGLVK